MKTIHMFLASLVTLMVLALGFAPAAQASSVVAPATQVTTQQVGPVDYDPITDPYTGHLADRLMGSDLVGPEPTGVDRSNERLIELQRALSNGIVRHGAIYTQNGGKVQWAKLSDTQIVMRSNSSAWESVILPTTGAKYLMAPYSGDIVHGKPAALNIAVTPVQGAIGQSYLADGGQDVFGYPTGTEVAVSGGAKQSFTKGATFYWSPATGAHPVKGGIGAKYHNAGGLAALGYPTMAERKLASGGVYQQYQKGRIYWSPSTGAHVVDQGDIGRTYVSMGGSTSALGYPTSSKIKLSSSKYVQYFGNGFIGWENGDIIVSTSTGVITR